MVDLSRIQLSDTITLGAALRTIGREAESLESAAQQIVDHLYSQLCQEGVRSTALVRLYKTCPSSDLDPELTAFARGILGGAPLSPSSACLVLMATRGERAAWNDRHASVGHKAIPLPDAAFVERLPMVSEVFRQLGIAPRAFLESDEAALDAIEQRGCRIFLVEEAKGSEFIPAQDFVVEHGIRSVVAFGGLLPGAQLFVVLLFAKVPVTRAGADLLAPISLNLKLALLPLCAARTLD